MRMKTAVSLCALVVLAMSVDAYAATCNPKAQSHQRKAQEIQMWFNMNGVIPSPEDEAFVLCMMSEKEDRDDFKQRVQKQKDKRAAQQAQEESQRRQAAAALAAPANAEDIQWREQYCGSFSGRGEQAVQYCKQLFTQYPHSRCAAGNLPCGQKCFCANCGQICAAPNNVQCTPQGRAQLLC